MILKKDKETTAVGDELYYRSKKYCITLITDNYVTINNGRTIKIAYDPDGYPKITKESIGKQIRIPIEVFNKLGWSVVNGN